MPTQTTCACIANINLKEKQEETMNFCFFIQVYSHCNHDTFQTQVPFFSLHQLSTLETFPNTYTTPHCPTTFRTGNLHKCSANLNIGLPHVLKLVGGKQGHAPCKIRSLHKSSFLCRSNVMEIIRLLKVKAGHPHFFYITGFNTMVSVSPPSLPPCSKHQSLPVPITLWQLWNAFI